MCDYSELKKLAEACDGWNPTECWPEETDDGDLDVNWFIGRVDEDDEKWPLIQVDTAQYDNFDGAGHLARFYAAANPTAVKALIAENEQLRDSANMRAIRSLRGDCADLVAERDQLKAENESMRKDAERAAYWKRRAKSAEGHLFSGDFREAAMELHKYSRFESTPWPELTGSQHALIHGAAGAVISVVNRLRDARRPKDRDDSDGLAWCACGDGYPANSWGAGFMDANNGVCANCDAAIGKGEQS